MLQQQQNNHVRAAAASAVASLSTVVAPPATELARTLSAVSAAIVKTDGLYL
jgi:hypothetical protein